MHAREKPLKNFGLVPLRCRHGRWCRALAVIMMPIMPASELVSMGRHRAADIVDLGAAASLKKRTSKPRTGSEADRNHLHRRRP
jgi:hypothetical protein